MPSRRLISAAAAIVLAFGASLASGMTTPASAASSVTCNGGYTSTGPMGTFTYTFSANLNWASQNATHSVKMVMTYRADGYLARTEHYANNSGIVSFKVTGTDPALVQGVDITDETFIDGESAGAMFVHPSCRTYAQEPAPIPTPVPTGAPAPLPGAAPAPAPVVTGSVPSRVVGIKAKVKGKQKRKNVVLSWRAAGSAGSPVTQYRITGSKKATTRKTKVVFKRLKRGTYKFRVTAVNKYGKGAGSKVVRVKVR